MWSRRGQSLIVYLYIVWHHHASGLPDPPPCLEGRYMYMAGCWLWEDWSELWPGSESGNLDYQQGCVWMAQTTATVRAWAREV